MVVPVAVWALVFLSERSVAGVYRRVVARRTGDDVRYVFGSYDPYRDEEHDRVVLERDVSYVGANYDLYDDEGYDDGSYDVPAYARYGDAVARSGVQPMDEVYDDEGEAAGELADVAVLTPAAHARPGRVEQAPVRRRESLREIIAGQRARRRRRQVFFTLASLFVGTLAVALWLRTPVAWGAHVAAVTLFVTYINLLVRHHHSAEERQRKVRELAPVSPYGRRPSVVVLRGENVQ